MSLLAFFTATKPASQEKASDLVPPYNAPAPLSLPRVYETDNATHPDVLDFGVDPAGWFGQEPHRFWMAFTPFPPAELENPSVVCSKDGITWVTPKGLTNPIAPTPSQEYNSDTDMIYDPVSKRLGVVWRAMGADMPDGTYKPGPRFHLKWSTDGVTWSERIDMNDGTIDMGVAPSLVREEDGSWTMFTCASGGLRRYTSREPSGPWVAGPVTTAGTPSGALLWHGNVIRHRGQYRMVMRYMDGKFYPAVSENGKDWRFGPSFMSSVHPWEIEKAEGDGMYRATMTPHENEADYRFWYGASGSRGWRIGYTLVPQSLWTALG